MTVVATEPGPRTAGGSGAGGEPSDIPVRRSGMRRWYADPWWWLAGVAVTAVRWWEASDRRVFHVVPDEPAQLAMARWISGGTRWNMFDHLTYRPGYALVLAPVARLAGSGEAFVRAALGVNALLAGVSAMVLARILVVWTDLHARERAAVATVTALAPAAIASSAYTWAEPLITLVFLATLLATQRFVDAGRRRDALAAVAIAAFATLVHGRLLPLLPAVTAVCVVVAVRVRRWQLAGGVVVTALALGVVSRAITAHVIDAVWDEPGDANSSRSVLERLDTPAALVDAAVGQIWYQLVATAGLVALGVGIVLSCLARRGSERRRSVVLIALTAPLALTGIAFMSGRPRSDQLVYGRYLDAIAWPITALGIVWVVRRLRRFRASGHHLVPVVAALVTAITGLTVAARHGEQLADDVGLRFMVPGLLPYIGRSDGVPVLLITTIVTTALLALALLAAHRERSRLPSGVLAAGTVAVLAVTAWGGSRVHDAEARTLNVWDIGDDVSAIDAIVPAGEPIGVLMVEEQSVPDYGVQRQRFQLYQLYLPDRSFVWERSPGALVSRFVVAPAQVAELTRAGAVVRWRDSGKAMALWEMPNPAAADAPTGSDTEPAVRGRSDVPVPHDDVLLGQQRGLLPFLARHQSAGCVHDPPPGHLELRRLQDPAHQT